ncbi:ribosomal L11 RNA methyltransferase (SAM-dependent) [Methanobrevibacter smithii CAG:186]|uniref:Ribosomal L11 RNA methyltransferase (SAM-dependent) n=1 Tax=Methanobrevibacter smithii CAG:186 TaxID=1263088 RepID=R7PUC3_METSM|nr:METTL5 family protein [Methanobrevibacter smithii]CDF28975.1 ribosomal L11 RNA methyltransferase (SAM-dependent) [Methanobrevibacter smithii CAG:186]
MKKITKKKHLEMAIQKVPKHPNPKVDLEQYSTPATIAADLLWNAYSLGDIADKKVMDLGCGTGIFAIASKLLGAASAIGVDIDKDSIDLASSYCGDVNFICSDICDLENDFDVDTIFQNPPFGSQKNAKKGADLKFISKAIELSPKVLYSFHMASTEEFLISYFEKNDLEITHIFRYNFPIPKIYEFHTMESANVEVIVIRAFL